jgi:DNA polymerase-1
MSYLLVDTYSLFFRSFYGLPPMTTSAGVPTGALYGFSSLLLKLLRELSPAGAAFALDLPSQTFRHSEYAGYKAGRAATPTPLREQLTRLPELLEAFGFPSFGVAGFEADDVLATLACELAQAGQSSLIASGDRDLLQLVSDRTEVIFLGQRGKPAKRYGPSEVLARFGVPAQQLPSYVALVGDPSDNLPKLPGVGEATASKLVARFGSIEGMLAQLEDISDARLREKIASHAEQLRTNERLARLRQDVPLAAGPRTKGLTREALERLGALFESLEFKSLLSRLESLSKSAGEES